VFTRRVKLRSSRKLLRTNCDPPVATLSLPFLG
jgi:hypothetical protein